MIDATGNLYATQPHCKKKESLMQQSENSAANNLSTHTDWMLGMCYPD